MDEQAQPVWLPIFLQILTIFPAVLRLMPVVGLLRAGRGVVGAALLTGCLPVLQAGPGIGKVLIDLPLGVAAAHDRVAALLPVSLI